MTDMFVAPDPEDHEPESRAFRRLLAIERFRSRRVIRRRGVTLRRLPNRGAR